MNGNNSLPEMRMAKEDKMALQKKLLANVPSSAIYSVPRKSAVAERARILTKVLARETSISANQRQMTFEIPAQSYVDMSGAYVSFSLTITGTTNDVSYPTSGVEQIINRLTITSGSGSVIEDIFNYDVIACLINKAKGLENDQSVGLLCSGVVPIGGFIADNDTTVVAPSTVNNMASASATLTRDFCFRLNASGLFQCDKLLPAKYMGAGFAFRIQAQLNTAGAFLKQGTTTDASYSIANACLWIPYVEPKPEFDMAVRSAVMSDTGLMIPLREFRNFQFSVPSGSSSAQYSCVYPTYSLKSAFVIHRLSANIGALSADKSNFANPEPKTVQLKHGSYLYPSEALNGVRSSTNRNMAELAQESFKALGYTTDVRSGANRISRDYVGTDTSAVPSTGAVYEWVQGGTASSGDGTDFFYALDLDKTESEASIISGLDTRASGSAVPVEILTTFNAPVGALTADVFLFSDEVMIVNNRSAKLLGAV